MATSAAAIAGLAIGLDMAGRGMRHIKGSRVAGRRKKLYAPKRRPLRKKGGVKKQLKELKRLAESDMGTHIHRIRDYRESVALVNLQDVRNLDAFNADICNTVIAQLRYYNPSAPTTLTVADGATGTYQREFYFKNSFSRITVRNNYRVPCMLTVYECRPRADTDKDPLTAMSQGLTDLSNVTETSPLIHPTDSIVLTDLWRIKRRKKMMLDAGRQCSVSASSPPFQYDPALFQTHDLKYMTRFKALSWLTIVQGVPAHDSVADEQGLNGVGVEIMVDTSFKVKYAAGADIQFVYVTDNSDTFSNAAVVTNKPISSNQSYGLALGL